MKLVTIASTGASAVMAHTQFSFPIFFEKILYSFLIISQKNVFSLLRENRDSTSNAYEIAMGELLYVGNAGAVNRCENVFDLNAALFESLLACMSFIRTCV